ncbi:MAG: hypothetical protein K2I07_02325 [Lachnospiraceae bacterium]|nr:hypothetical protein [Lachnospiraceae bacterium]
MADTMYLFKQADKTIVLIDGYVDIVTLNISAKKKDGVDVILKVQICLHHFQRRQSDVQ